MDKIFQNLETRCILQILKKKMKRWEVEDTTSGIMQSRYACNFSCDVL